MHWPIFVVTAGQMCCHYWRMDRLKRITLASDLSYKCSCQSFFSVGHEIMNGCENLKIH